MLRVDKRILHFKKRISSLVLMSIYGIGSRASAQFLTYLGVNAAYIVLESKIDSEHYIFFSLSRLFDLIESYLGIQYKRRSKYNLEILRNIKSYRGIRFFFGLPIRGQRRHTNARTARKAIRSKYRHKN